MSKRMWAAAVFFGVASAAAQGQVTVRASVAAAAAEQGDGSSTSPVSSADGRFVAFESDAANLVTGDTNDARDVFVRDGFEGTTTLVSRTANGRSSNGRSSAPSLSADGRHVAFVSDATDLVAGETSGERRVYVRDLWVPGALAVAPFLASAPYDASEPSISADGRWIAATVSRDGVHTQIVVLDRDADGDGAFDQPDGVAAILASATSSGAPGNAPSFLPSMSGDGRLVAFASDASDLVTGDAGSQADVFVRDLALRSTRRVSVSPTGAGGNGHSGGHAGSIRYGVSISRDGRFVAFGSDADNLVANDRNGVADVFVRDLSVNRTTLVSIGTTGAQGDSISKLPSISSDGRFVAFTSAATTLYPQDTNETTDVFVRDRDVGGDGELDESGDVATERVSIGTANDEANAASARFAAPSISGDGEIIAFDSAASNLVPSDTNAVVDVFVRDRRPCGASTVNADGIVANVLRLNQSLGEVPTRVVTVGVGEPVSVRLNASPAGPDPARYVLWVWTGEPVNPTTLDVFGTHLGCTVNPSPFVTFGRPAPRLCLLGGLDPAFCADVPRLEAPARAPFFRTRGRGFSRPSTFTVQGVIEDSGTITGRRLGITNAVVLRVR